jgi:hypothetical protein
MYTVQTRPMPPPTSADTAAFAPSVTANIVASAALHNTCQSRIRTDWRAAAASALVLTDNKNATVLAAERSARVAFVRPEENASRAVRPAGKGGALYAAILAASTKSWLNFPPPRE